MTRLLRRLLRIHSPSRGILGTCRCRPCTRSRNAARRAGLPYTIPEHMAAGFAAADPPTIEPYGDSANFRGMSLDRFTIDEAGHVEVEHWVDPTHGRIDRDIQEAVDALGPQDVGQRVAMENTRQTRRDREAGHGC